MRGSVEVCNLEAIGLRLRKVCIFEGKNQRSEAMGISSGGRRYASGVRESKSTRARGCSCDGTSPWRDGW